MIRVKNLDLTNDSIKLLNQISELDLNAKSAFKLMRIIKDLSKIIEDKLEMEKKIFNKYLLKDENGNPIPSLDENGNPIKGTFRVNDMNSFTKEMNELMSVEVEILHDKIKFDDLNLDENFKVKDLMKIDFLFE